MDLLWFSIAMYLGMGFEALRSEILRIEITRTDRKGLGGRLFSTLAARGANAGFSPTAWRPSPLGGHDSCRKPRPKTLLKGVPRVPPADASGTCSRVKGDQKGGLVNEQM